jgi:hypothetical protein
MKTLLVLLILFIITATMSFAQTGHSHSNRDNKKTQQTVQHQKTPQPQKIPSQKTTYSQRTSREYPINNRGREIHHSHQHDNYKVYKKYRPTEYNRHIAERRVIVVPQNRVIIRNYYRDESIHYPVRARRAYYVGDQLPFVNDLPPRLLVQLQPLPRGYRYAILDTNIYLISTPDRRIIDVIDY